MMPIGLDDIRQAIDTYRPPTNISELSINEGKENVRGLTAIRNVFSNTHEGPLLKMTPNVSADPSMSSLLTPDDTNLLILNFERLVAITTIATERCNTAYSEMKDMKRTIKEFENLVDACREREHRHISGLHNHMSIQKSLEEKLSTIENEANITKKNLQDCVEEASRDLNDAKKNLKMAEVELESQKSANRSLRDELMELRSRMTHAKSDAELQEISLHHRKIEDENLSLRDQLLAMESQKLELNNKIGILQKDAVKTNGVEQATRIQELEKQVAVINKERHEYVQYCQYLLSLVDTRTSGKSEATSDVHVKQKL